MEVHVAVIFSYQVVGGRHSSVPAVAQWLSMPKE